MLFFLKNIQPGYILSRVTRRDNQQGICIQQWCNQILSNRKYHSDTDLCRHNSGGGMELL